MATLLANIWLFTDPADMEQHYEYKSNTFSFSSLAPLCSLPFDSAFSFKIAAFHGLKQH